LWLATPDPVAIADASPGDLTDTCPSSETGDGKPRCADLAVTQPPEVTEVSPAGRAVALAFAALFLRDLLDAPNGEGQASTTRGRVGFPGGNAIGLGVRLLRGAGLIKAVGVAHSCGQARHGGLERVWAVTDRALAEAWLRMPVAAR